MHAALGEPVRLAIADRLLLSDASPGELSAALGPPTNLMAHHLKVLDEAGLIRRVRSEGDRRRLYVQLNVADPLVALLLDGARLAPDDAAAGAPRRVVFVCTHNSARSQLAAASWTRVSRTPAASAGTHPAARLHPRAVRAAHRHGLQLGRARPAHVADVLNTGDLIVAVCDNAHEELTTGDGPRLHWAVPDPARVDTDDAFEAAYLEITERVNRLAHAIDPAPAASGSEHA
jgi:protein-tyrosine-phosphatase/DNA-binding transcriptional ArsR family regulator